MSWGTQEQFAVTKIINWEPYRVHLGTPSQAEALYCLLLEFCRSERTCDEMNEHLAAHTSCPPERVKALRMTLTTQLYLWRSGGYCKLLDDGFTSGQRSTPARMWTTEQGLAWLQAQRERAA